MGLRLSLGMGRRGGDPIELAVIRRSWPTREECDTS